MRKQDKAARRAGQALENAASVVALIFGAQMIVGVLLESQPVAGLAAMCIGVCCYLFAAGGVVSGQHVTQEGIYRRMTGPFHFWAMTAVMAAFGAVFLVAGVPILAGIIEAGFHGR